jgi:hypothetical protein
MRKLLVPMVMSLAVLPLAAHAQGCLKGAAVGVVAGHVAGHHAVAGAALGCIVGHHRAKVKERRTAQPPSGGMNTGQPSADTPAR